MQISVNELEVIVLALLSRLKENKGVGGQIVIESDYYWFINKDKLYNPYEEPRDFTLGQLTMDWSDLQALAASDKEFVSYDLVKLSAIVRAIGDENVW